MYLIAQDAEEQTLTIWQLSQIWLYSAIMHNFNFVQQLGESKHMT